MMSLFDLLQQIIAAEGDEVKLKLPSDPTSPRLRGAGGINLLSLKILKAEAKRRGKRLKLKAGDAKGKQLLAVLEEAIEPAPTKIIGGRFRMPRIKIRWGFFKRLLVIPLLLFGILLFLGGGGLWAWNYLPRAEVTLTLKPIPMVKEVNLTAKTGVETIDIKKDIIPGTKVSVTEEGEKTVSATGSKTVGEKAKGSITFVNCTDSPVTFSAGTVLKIEGKDLTYTIDGAVEAVPAKSDPTSCGSKSGSVTAAEIGTGHNQSVGAEFDFVGEGYSNTSFDAYVASGQAISGGTSQDITIVSSADQAKVLDALKKELIEQGKASLEEQAGSDQAVYQEAIKQEVVEQNFLQEVGEESDKAGLSMKIKFTTVVYDEGSLHEFISQALVDLIPESYELFPGEMAVEPLDAELSDSKALKFSAKVTAQVIPKLDVEGIKNDLAGLNTAGAQEYLSSLENITGYELRLWPNLPESLKRVPRNTERIRIELTTEE